MDDTGGDAESVGFGALGVREDIAAASKGIATIVACFHHTMEPLCLDEVGMVKGNYIMFCAAKAHPEYGVDAEGVGLKHFSQP